MLSIITVALFILQIMRPSLGALHDVNAEEIPENETGEKVGITLTEQEDNRLSWQVDVNVAEAEHDGIDLEIVLDEALTLLTFESEADITPENNDNRYSFNIPASHTHHEITLDTTFDSKSEEALTVTAHAVYGEATYTAKASTRVEKSKEQTEATDEVEKEREAPAEREAVEEELGEDEVITASDPTSVPSADSRPMAVADTSCIAPKPDDGISELDYDKDTYSKDVRDYNLIVFGEHIFSGGETEGATAVQGDVVSGGTIDYGSANRFGEPDYNQIGMAPLPDRTPGLVVGGEVKGTTAIYNGLVMTEDADGGIEIRTGDRVCDEQANIDQVFAGFQTYIDDHQTSLDFFKPTTSISPSATGAIAEDLSTYFVPDTDNEKVLTLNITGDLLKMKSFYFPNIDDYEKVIIYSDAKEIEFGSGSMLYNGGVIDTQATIGTPGNDLLHMIASKVTWSFPNAETITANSFSIVGTLIAPNAHFKSTGGSLSGQAFVKDLTTGVYSFNQLRNTVEEPSPGLGEIEITKVDADDDSIFLAGAKFNILNAEGDVLGELVTDEDGRAISERLDIGDYTLVEREAPDGYQLLTGTIDARVEKDEVTEITITNSKTPTPTGKIKVTKVDGADDSIKLAAAKFNILDAAGNVVGELVTDDKGEATSSDLEIGEYTLEETEAPTDYELLTETISVTVQDDDLMEIVIKNEKTPDPLGKITLRKVDAADHDALLAGATFTLRDETGQEIAREQTNDHGEIIFQDLVLATYYVTEIEAPDGYRLLSSPIEILLTKEDYEKESVIENTKIDWEIPETGGIGSLGFYGVGLLFILTAAWFAFRKRKA